MAALRDIEGFTSYPAEAFWLECDKCNEAELFYGDSADSDADVWASEHECEA